MKKYIQKILGVFLILKYNVDQVKSLKENFDFNGLLTVSPQKNLEKN